MPRGLRVTSAQVVGVMPVRSPESRQRPFDVGAFLSGNTITAGCAGNPGEQEEIGIALRRSARILLGEKNSELDARHAALLLCDFHILAARIALAGDDADMALAELQTELEDTARRLTSADPASAAEIQVLAYALRRSSGIVRLDRDQLPEQVLFRLGDQDGPLLRRVIQGAMSYKSGCWLRPLTATAESWQEVTGYLHGNASAVCFDPRGRLLVVDNKGWLECRDLSGSEPPQPFLIGKEEPTGLASDGAFAAIPTRDGPIRIVDFASGQRDPLVPAGAGATLAVAFVRPGCLASGRTDGSVRLWDVPGGREVSRFDVGDLNVEVLVPLGADRLAVGTEPDEVTRHTLQIWNLRTGQRDAVFGPHDWPVTALDIAHEAGLLIAAANDELSAWHLPDLSCAWRVQHEHVTFHALACVSGQVLAGDSNGALRVLSLRDGTEVRRLPPHSGLVPAIAVDANHHRLVTVSYDQSIRLWDTAVLERPGPLGHQQQVSALALTCDGSKLLSGSKDGRVLLRDARTGTLEAEFGRHEHWVSAVATLHGDLAVSAGWDGTIRVWDLRGGRGTAVIKTGDAHLTGLACDPDANLAVTVSTDGTVRVWDLASGDERAMMTSPDSRVAAVGIDGDRVRWVTESGRLFSWRARTAPVSIDLAAAGRVTACDLGAPGGSVILGLADGQLVEVGADGSTESFGDADCGPTSIARDASGRLVLAAYGVPHVSSDNTARLWAGTDRSAATAVLAGDFPWTAAAVAGDGRCLYLGDESGAVHIVEPVLPGLSRLGPAQAAR